MYNYTQLPPEKCDFVDVASEADLPPNERLFLEIDGQAIVIFNIAGQLYAIGDLCSHDDGPLGDGNLDGFEAVCPRHGARFDVRDGRVTALPAVDDIPAYPVRLRDGQIEIGLPKNA